MKNKIICIGMILCLLLASILANSVDIDENKRIWQHEVNQKEVKTEKTSDFNTHLPIISIDTNNQEIPGEERSGATILTNLKILDDETKNNYLTDTPKVESLAEIKYRGRSSMYFDKKGYSIHLVDSEGNKNEQEIMGMTKHNEWILHGPFLDKTLIRNYLFYNLSGEIMEYAPNCRFCEMFLDGEYQGLYLMVESITVADEGRVNITKYDQGDIASSYIIRLDTGNTDSSRNIETFGQYVGILSGKEKINIEYPKSSDTTEEIKSYIEKDFSKFEKMLNSFDHCNYEQYIDTDSFVDYFLINEFTKNYDAGSLSTYLYKDIRGKLKFCVWDFNNACDNFQERSMQNEELDIFENNWYYMLFKNEDFTDAVIKRYYELREKYFNEEYLNKQINDTIEYLGDAIDRNFEVWGYTFDEDWNLLEPAERNLHSYDEAVMQLKNFLSERITYLNQNIEHIKQYSHESVNKKYNH